MSYLDYIIQLVDKRPVSDPIYLSDIGKAMSRKFGLPYKKAMAAASVALKRAIDTGRLPDVRKYKNGIYYRVDETPFGETSIDTWKMAVRKYMSHDQGYETDYGLLYALGLTTQLPNTRTIATNHAGRGARMDLELEVLIRQPRMTISADNKLYLQCLDAVWMLDKAPVDAVNPYLTIGSYIARHELEYKKLLSMACRYYPKQVPYALARVADEEVRRETA